MNLTSLALLLVLLAMLFAIFTQRLLLSTNTDIYDPIATKLEDVRNGFSGMKESIVSKLDHYRDIIVDNGKDLSITPSRLQHSSLQQEITETEDLWHEEIVDWTAGLKSSMKKANTRASNSTKSHASVEVPTQVVSSKKKNILTDLRHRPLYDKTGKHVDPYRDEGGLNLVANNYIKVNTSDLKTLPKNDITMMDNIQASPREGTDISLHHQLNNLKCPNQSHCIVPKLQLIPKFKIYLCKHPVKQGVRFYFISKEGFLLHPNVELLSYEDIELADYVMYLPGSAPWHRTECNDSSLANKLIVMDEFDGHGHFMPFGSPKEMIRAGYNLHASSKNEFLWYFMYFKRSYIVRKNGALRNFPHLLRPDFYPITYSLAEAYVRPVFNFNREMEIVCTLRGSPQQPARKRVQTWVEEYVKERSIEKAVVGQVEFFFFDVKNTVILIHTLFTFTYPRRDHRSFLNMILNLFPTLSLEDKYGI